MFKKTLLSCFYLCIIMISTAQTTVGPTQIIETDCVEFSIDTYDAVIKEKGTAANAYTAMNAAYDFCVNNGGRPGDSIVVLN